MSNWKYYQGLALMLMAILFSSFEITSNIAPLIFALWGAALIIADSIDNLGK